MTAAPDPDRLFATNMASTTKLATMILPQLERGTHGVKVAGMMFFDDNVPRAILGARLLRNP